MRKRILLADEDEGVRKMIGRVLESAGYVVVNAGSGSEAVTKFCSGQPDLVVLDLRLPEGDGWETSDQIRRRNARVPVVVITSWPNQQEVATGRGIAALMEKPLDMPLLLDTIRKLLDEAEGERARNGTERKLTVV